MLFWNGKIPCNNLNLIFILRYQQYFRIIATEVRWYFISDISIICPADGT